MAILRRGEKRPARFRTNDVKYSAATVTIDLDTILIIDDEPHIRRAVAAALSASGTRVLAAPNATEGIAVAEAEDPDLFILDLGLPDGTGIEVCRSLRGWSSAPIIVLSARDAESEKVALLTAGADDYVSKPFGVEEFVARVHAHLRRSRTPIRSAARVLEIDDLTIDVSNRRVSRGAKIIPLTPTEWSILRMLVAHAGKTVTHRALFDGVWGREFGSPSSYLRVYVTHLRRKIEVNPATPRVIVTEPGVGYFLRCDDSELTAAAPRREESFSPDDGPER
jgi:two-component system KDP operon response regulator KdpE